MTKKQQLLDIARKLRFSEANDIEKVISRIVIALHHIESHPKMPRTSETMYVLTITQKVMETYLKMSAKGNLGIETVMNFKKHMNKASVQLETFSKEMPEDILN